MTSFGVRSDGVYRTVGDGNDVTVYNDFDTVERAQAFLYSTALADAMKSAGVTGEAQIWFTEFA